MPGPLTGLRVIDCSRGMAGPRATGMLADYGADVIWVEPPGGDPWRAELAAAYSVYNRGKRSIALDLKVAADRDTLFELLESADVFVQSWTPGVAERLGVGFDVVHERFPSVVYCAVSGFGANGPDVDLAGFDPLVHALLGTMGDQAGHRDGPIFVSGPAASNGAAYLALVGILASLYRREADGWGRHVETSLMDGMLAYVSQAWGYSDRNRDRYRTGGTRFLIKTLRCADDEYVGVHTGARGAFDRLMALLGLDDRVRALENSEAGTPLSAEEEAALATLPDIFERETRDVWLQKLLDAGICGMPVLRPGEVFDEPQTAHNEMVVEVDDTILGRVQQVAPPTKFSKTPPQPGAATPAVDQHGQQIRADLASGAWARPAIERGVLDDRPLLAGLKVVDIGHWFAGPYASRLLADLGADVIKLEPVEGDPMRGLERPFSTAQAGKRSIALDLSNPESASVAQRLLKWADVVHHNMRPGIADKLGVGFEQSLAVNPQVVYLHASGWGSTGPFADRQSFAPLMGGYVGSHYEAAGQFNPPVDPIANEDSGGGLLGAVSALMALLHRARAGEGGQMLEAPHFHTALADISHIVRGASDHSVIGADTLDPMQFGTDPFCRLYPTADGWLCLVAVTEPAIAALGKVLGVDSLCDESLRTREGRLEQAFELESALFDAFSALPTAQIVGDLRAAGVPAAEPRVQNNRGFMDDEHNLAIGRVAEYDHPRFGRTRESGVLVRFRGADVPKHRRPPELAEHTDEIMAMLGFGADTVAAMEAAGVIRIKDGADNRIRLEQ